MVETGNQSRQECLIQNELHIDPFGLRREGLEMSSDSNVATGRGAHFEAIILVARAKYRGAIEILVDSADAIPEIQEIVKIESVVDQCERPRPHRKKSAPARVVVEIFQ